jgi:rare lipoprotein A
MPASRLRIAASCLGLLALAGCVGGADFEPPPPPVPVPAPPPFEQIGEASWYGAFHHGRTTASGAPFDMHDLTAAHRSLPLGTEVEVTNLENGRSVTVLVNDRGPYAPGRIIDLSRRAAERLGMREQGVATVKVEVLREGERLETADTR